VLAAFVFTAKMRVYIKILTLTVHIVFLKSFITPKIQIIIIIINHLSLVKKKTFNLFFKNTIFFNSHGRLGRTGLQQHGTG